MAITSMLFLFCFLPAALSIYYISNDEIKEYVLLAVSLIFYSLGSLPYLILFVISISLTVALGRLMNISRRIGARRLLLVLGITVNISILGYYKYSNIVIPVLNRMFAKEAECNPLLPLGISFFTFKAISYLADIYTGKIKFDKISRGGGI